MRRDLVRLDANQLGFVHVLVSEFHDALRQRRRKQHIETFVGVRQAPQQIADILDEAKVEHAISLIENGDFDLVEFEHTLLEVVDDASRRADKQIDTIQEYVALLVIISAAVREANFEPRVLA